MPELVTCALGVLTMNSLAYTAHLSDCQRPSRMISMKIPFISLFWSWMEGLLALFCCPLSAANMVSHSKGLCIQPFLPLINGSLDGS